MPVLNLRQTAADGAVNRIALDTDADDFAPRLEDHFDALRDEARRPVETALSAAETERDAFREIAVAEILRVEQLSAGEGFDLEAERAFYESLPAAKLKLHFDKARARGVSLTPKTSAEDATPEGEDAAYGNVTTA